MTTILEFIFKRRSIRKYEQKAVDKETITLLLQAAMAAPSASNRQPWEFVAVTDQNVMAQFREKMPYGKFYAPAAILVCAKAGVSDYWVQDCSAATQNILVAAAGLGLGSVWLGVHPREERVQAMREVLHLPDDVQPLSLIYFGYPAEEQPARTQYDPARVHWDVY